jgi:HSP20 family protein
VQNVIKTAGNSTFCNALHSLHLRQTQSTNALAPPLFLLKPDRNANVDCDPKTEFYYEGELIMSLPTRVNRALAADPFESVQRDFESMLGRMINGRGEGASRLAPYGVDVREDGDHLYVEAELPGFKKEEVDITLENQTLTISGERRETPEKENKGEWLLNERRYTRFLRSFTLPPTVSEQSVNARLENGVLTITLNKREESKPRKIAVS